MDFDRRAQIAEDVEKFLKDKMADNPFHAIIAVESTPGDTFVFEIGTLNERSPLQAWKAIVNAIAETAQELLERLNRPPEKPNKPIEPK